MIHIAYHGDPKLKHAVLARVRRHREMDQIVQGRYWEEDGGVFRGCAVGCTLHSDRHADYEPQLGIPAALAYLQDSIFEGLPIGKARAWPEEFLDAIPVGADLSLVWHGFAAWLILDPKHGVVAFNDDRRVRDVGELHRRVLAGSVVTSEEWDDARDATDAACYAADAAGAAAGDAAGDAARDAADASFFAADAAGDAAGDANAARDAYDAQRQKLLELLRAAPVPQNPQTEPCSPLCEEYKASLRREGVLS